LIEFFEEHPSGAKALAPLGALAYGLKPVPFKTAALAYGLKPVPFKTAALAYGLKPVPFKAAA
jgi:hypothetical protein